MIINRQQDVTDVVLDAMSRAPDDRLRTVMAAFVRHLHEFAREVRLTETEFEFAIDFLNRIGQATNDSHNEGVLFSDAVGLSTVHLNRSLRILREAKLVYLPRGRVEIPDLARLRACAAFDGGYLGLNGQVACTRVPLHLAT